MAKHFLNTNEEDLDFVLIGLTSSENQYHLLSLVNDALNIKMSLNDYIPFNLKDGKIFKFSLFDFEDEELGLHYYFVPNLSNFEEPRQSYAAEVDLFTEMDVDERVRLIKELPKTDYFLILKGEDLHMHQFKIAEKLKSISEIVQLQNIEPGELPSRRNLVF